MNHVVLCKYDKLSDDVCRFYGVIMCYMLHVNVVTFSVFREVLEVMAGARGEDISDLATALFDNTLKLFKTAT